ncbi:MAG: hypothetical protein K2X50_01785 [Gammaproteobacteria bacterium]|nr:hypothetical protein [Gammaproteobacteria bacterium]
MKRTYSPDRDQAIAPVTYWFAGGKLRFELENIDDTDGYRLCIIVRDQDEERILTKTIVDKIFWSTIQYDEVAKNIIFLSTSKKVTILHINGQKIDEIELGSDVKCFLIYHESQKIVIHTLDDSVWIYHRAEKKLERAVKAVATAVSKNLLFFIATDGTLTSIKYDESNSPLATKSLVNLRLTANSPIISIHPSLPIVAITNNEYCLNGKRIEISLYHLETGGLLGVITDISFPIREMRWLPKTNRLLCVTRAVQPISGTSNDYIEIISLDNFHEHFIFECASKTIQVVTDSEEKILLTSQLGRAQSWRLPSRQSKQDKLTFKIRLESGELVQINGIGLLKLLHASVQEVLTPIVLKHKGYSANALRTIRQGEDWLRTAGRLATYVSGEIASVPSCSFLRNDQSKLYGDFTIGVNGQHQTRVETKKEHVSIKHAASGRYPDIAKYINGFLELQAIKVSTEKLYQAMCSIVYSTVRSPEFPLDQAHASLARVLKDRLRGNDYPREMSGIFKEFLDSLLLLMFGMEGSRINTTFLTGSMLLDLIENHCTFGRLNRVFSWQNMFTSGPGYHWNDFEQRDLGGKFPLASNSTGPDNFKHRTAILGCSEADEPRKLKEIIEDYQHYRALKKEIHITLHWLYNLSMDDRLDLARSNNLLELRAKLKDVFKRRLVSAFNLQPNVSIPRLITNSELCIRQYELQQQSQQLTGLKHYYLVVTNITTLEKKSDKYYHRIDIPCKLLPADYLSGLPKVINVTSQHQDTKAEVFLVDRQICGIRKTFNRSSLKDSILEDSGEVVSMRQKTIQTQPTSTSITSMIELMLFGPERYAEFEARKKRQHVEQDVTHPTKISVPLCVLVERYIQEISMPYFDFFAFIPEECVVTRAIMNLKRDYGRFVPEWIGVVGSIENLDRILQLLTLKDFIGGFLTQKDRVINKIQTIVRLGQEDLENFANVILEQYSHEQAQFDRSMIRYEWIRIAGRRSILYNILRKIQFINITKNVDTLTGEITKSSIIDVIRLEIQLSDEVTENFAISILKVIEHLLLNRRMQAQPYYIPEVLVNEVVYVPNSNEPPQTRVYPKKEFIDTVIRLANEVSSVNLSDKQTIILAMKIIHKLTNFNFERVFSVRSCLNTELAPCPRCYAETAPSYPGLPYDYDQTVCLVSDQNPYYHRAVPREEDKGCKSVDLETLNILNTNLDPPQPLPTILSFVKHANERLGKQPCLACWLPLLRANATVQNEPNRRDASRNNFAQGFFAQQPTLPNSSSRSNNDQGSAREPLHKKRREYPISTQVQELNSTQKMMEDELIQFDDDDHYLTQKDKIPPEESNVRVPTVVNRKGLFNSTSTKTQTAKALLDNEIGQLYNIGVAVSRGDCFYDSFAQGLSSLEVDTNQTVKSLRCLCSQIVKSYPQGSEDQIWLRKRFNSDRDYLGYIMDVELTADECDLQSTESNHKYAVWGSPDIDGIILAKKFKVNLHCIEVREDDIDGGTHVHISHRIITPEGKSHNIEKDQVPEINTITVANWKDHFVPLFSNQTHEHINRPL